MASSFFLFFKYKIIKMQKWCMKKLTFYGPPVVQTLRDASHLDVSFFFFFFPLFILGISDQLLERKRKKFIRKTFPCVIIQLENDSRPRSYRLFRLFRPSATSFESKVSFPLTLFNPCLSSGGGGGGGGGRSWVELWRDDLYSLTSPYSIHLFFFRSGFIPHTHTRHFVL